MRPNVIAIGATAAIMALGAALIFEWAQPVDSRDRPSERRRETSDANVALHERQISELAREVRALRTRVSTDAALRDAAPYPSEAPAAQDEPETEPQDPVVDDPSPEERREQRVAFYASAHDSESRDRRVAPEFENSITASVQENELGAVEHIDCRSTICVLQIRHAQPADRDKLDTLFLRGPLKFGAFDYATEDGRTIAYVGMPGHSLRRTGI